MNDLVKDTGEREGEIEKIQMEFELQITLLEHQVKQLRQQLFVVAREEGN